MSDSTAHATEDGPRLAATVAFSQHSGSIQAPMVVSEIADGCLYSGFFGRLDSARMKQITDHIMMSVERSASETIIIDLASIDIIDSMVASHLSRLADTLQLVGVRPVFCGVSTIVAQTMVGTGVSFDRYTVVRNLKGALRLVLKLDDISISGQ